MKFCKNLQRVADISNAEWAPYYVNYKFLKKLIKELPSLDKGDKGPAVSERRPVETYEEEEVQQQHGVKTAEVGQSEKQIEELGNNPGEKAFFKLLYAELGKASRFFERAQQEFVIREERVREGIEIMKQPCVTEKWPMVAKSLYRLHKDLLLLETFAIMTYCAFSKILKKHDKVTGHQTRTAFMENVVNKANFTNYPSLLEMIGRCEKLYEEVSHKINVKEQLPCEDERLFINMITRLNEQVAQEYDGENSPSEGKPKMQNKESEAIITLQNLVEIGARNDAASAQRKRVAQAADSFESDDSNKNSKQPRTE
jgi:SPX domain protein involved in polyphosphate accumulation